MTRNEFLDNVNDWYELIEFCNDMGCSYCDDVYSEESMNDDINERLADWACEYTWQELLSKLDDIPSGYDYCCHPAGKFAKNPEGRGTVQQLCQPEYSEGSKVIWS